MENIRRQITRERAIELQKRGAQMVLRMASGQKPLTLSETLLVLGHAAGIAISSVDDAADRERLIGHLGRLAIKTASSFNDIVDQVDGEC